MTKPIPAELLYSVDNLLNLQAVKVSDTRWELYESGACAEDFDDRLIILKSKYGKSWVVGGYSDKTWTLEDEFALTWLLARAVEVATIVELVTLIGPCDEDEGQQDELCERRSEYVRNNSAVFGSK